jgi:predicted hydrocarbon binding protein
MAGAHMGKKSQMKGSAFSARFDYLHRRFPELWQEYLSRLQPQTRELATAHALKNAWYPFDAFVDLNVVADEVLGKRDLGLVKALGKHASDANLPSLYKLFYLVGSPEYIIRKAGALWSVHHTTGHCEVITHEPCYVEYQVHEFAQPHRVLCKSLEGFMERSLELSGVSQIRIEERQCAAAGAPYCSFYGRWVRS